MDGNLRKLETVIAQIEVNITGEVNTEALAKTMLLSVYEFRRIFAFLVGCPLSEYVRKRRLSLAACELMAGSEISIQALSEKYGYSTEAAFSKAFREYHGFSPSRCQKGDCQIKLFTRPKFELTVSGRDTASFQLKNAEAFSLHGLTMTSDNTDTCCCEAVWSQFYDGGYDGQMKGAFIYAAYCDQGEEVLCTIGEKTCEQGTLFVPACTWACFKMNTTDDGVVNQKYGQIYYEILPSAGMKRKTGVPIVEIFPIDMTEENFEWEIQIPIEKE